MADRTGYTYDAGSDATLTVINHGHDHFSQKIAGNNTGGVVKPGEALMLTEDGDGNPVFEYHDGSVTNTVYVAKEARGRGMNANTDEGYDTDEGITAVHAHGGGLNVPLAVGETVTTGDGLVPEPDTGKFIGQTSEGFIFGEADEALDLSGASAATFIKTEVSE